MVKNVTTNGTVLVPLEKSNNGWEGDAKEDVERCRGSCGLAGQLCKSHRKRTKQSSDPPAAVIKEAFYKYV